MSDHINPQHYNVDIVGPGPVGFFSAFCRDFGVYVLSRDPEHAICAMTEAGLPDGSVQFWRGETPTLRHSSIHVMGKMRIAMGSEYPARVKRDVRDLKSLKDRARLQSHSQMSEAGDE